MTWVLGVIFEVDSGAPRADARFPGMTGWDLGVDVQIRQSVQSVNPYEM